ncbi:hypothetical protein V2J33_03850 [Staphylococcus saccharolyticus]|nr:hypothetical protein [Staphylococcus saccharolyticus]
MSTLSQSQTTNQNTDKLSSSNSLSTSETSRHSNEVSGSTSTSVLASQSTKSTFANLRTFSRYTVLNTMVATPTAA